VLNLKFLPVQFSFFLILGIVLGFLFEISLYMIFIAVLVSFVFLIYFYFKAEISFKSPIYFVFFTSIIFLFIGILRIELQSPKHQKNHYSKTYTSKNKLILKIDKVLKTSKYYNKYEAKVIQVNQNITKGKILINRKKNENPFKVDEVLLTNNELTQVSKSLNPNAFDYQEYLKKQGVYHQIYLDKNNYIKLKNNQKTKKGIAFTFREKINKALSNYNFSPNELAIINAILLGQRQDINQEVFENYKNAGAIHILAVSGLHIGIILLFLNFLLQSLENFNKGKIFKLVIIIFCLWLYAFIAGLSASVVRAVTMFTAIAIGWMSNRPSSVKNSLVVSLFFLLLINPLFLFDVGFQLSYTAVFTIVVLHSYLKNLWNPKHKIVDYFWQLLMVSFAAQIGILPLSLYYFHQFPGLFFISSLVIIPFLGFILGGGIFIILLAWLQILPQFFADFYGLIIYLMNNFVAIIAQQEFFIFQNINFSFLSMLAVYLFLIASVQWVYKKTNYNLIYVLMAIISMQMVKVYEKNQNQKTNEFIVFHQVKKSILGNRIGNKMYIYYNSDSTNIKENNILKNYKRSFSKLTIQQNYNTKNVLKIDSKKTLIIDSIGIYSDLEFIPETVILTQSPKINLDRLIKTIHPKTIIADGSNYKSYTKLWQKTCKSNAIYFHDTSTKGAYQYRY